MPYAPLQRMLMPLGRAFGASYSGRLLGTASANLIAYWPLWEPSGTTANDISGNSRSGAYSNVTLGATGIGDGSTAATFNNLRSVCNVYSASLAGAFNGAEGTLFLWAKAASSTTWTSGGSKDWAVLSSDATTNNYVLFRRTIGVISVRYMAGGTIRSRDISTSTLLWFSVALTWSKSANQAIAYFNGTQQGAILTSLGTWSGSLQSSWVNVGALKTDGYNSWDGTMAHVALWNTPLSAAQISALATV